MFGDPIVNPKGWEIRTIGELYDVGSSKRVFESQWTKTGIPFYRAREIVKLSENGYVDNELFISAEMYEKYRNRYGVPKQGDIMVTGVGTIGVCYLVNHSNPFYFKDGNILWFRNKGAVNSLFMLWCYKHPYIRQQIEKQSSGSTVGTYTIANAKSTRTIYPPIELQNEFAHFVEQTDKSKVLFTQKLFFQFYMAICVNAFEKNAQMLYNCRREVAR